MNTEQTHIPVLLEETLEHLQVAGGIRFVDGTLGAGGHAREILRRNGEAEVLGIEKDSEMLEVAEEKLRPYQNRVHTMHGRFSQIEHICRQYGWEKVDGVLLDLGVSSLHLNEPRRGFSHRYDAPLDMRMDQSTTLTAAEILNNWSQNELCRILREYGEEKKATSLAKAIVEHRARKPWMRTGELKELTERVVGRSKHSSLPPATRTFQALRIAVNDELGELDKGLEAMTRVLKPGGRGAVISFHSLEDRRVKRFFRHEAAACICPPQVPQCRCGKIPRLRVITKKPLYASEQEKAQNPRAASARLRVAERVADAA